MSTCDHICRECGQVMNCQHCKPYQLPVDRARIAELEAALRNLVADVDDYERVNNLAPSPGRLHSWQSMRTAKEVLGNS